MYSKLCSPWKFKAKVYYHCITAWNCCMLKMPDLLFQCAEYAWNIKANTVFCFLLPKKVRWFKFIPKNKLVVLLWSRSRCHLNTLKVSSCFIHSEISHSVSETLPLEAPSGWMWGCDVKIIQSCPNMAMNAKTLAELRRKHGVLCLLWCADQGVVFSVERGP